jgi:hypothetical protein
METTAATQLLPALDTSSPKLEDDADDEAVEVELSVEEEPDDPPQSSASSS